MGDINPDVTDRPIEVPASPVSLQVGTATRDILIVVGVLPALIGVLGTRDVFKIVAYISSVEFAPTLGILVTAGVLGWRQWIARRKHAEDVVMARSAKDSVAVVKGDQ